MVSSDDADFIPKTLIYPKPSQTLFFSKVFNADENLCCKDANNLFMP